MTEADLVGRWDIVSWQQVYDDGRVQHPMGEDLRGFIRYTDDGDMAVMIVRADRANFTGGQWDASNDEKAAAYMSMLSYAGRYEVDGDFVVHHVDFSLFPNWAGGQQRRRVVVRADGTIALEARLEADTPEARTAQLVWRRHDPLEKR
jgi:hypothetical protein